MKKLIALASLLVVLSVSAQERPQSDKTQKEYKQRSGNNDKKRPTVDEKMKRFDSYNLTASQKTQIRALFEEREKNFSKNTKDKSSKSNDFDTKLEKILDKKQYNQYKEDRAKKLSARKEQNKNSSQNTRENRTERRNS